MSGSAHGTNELPAYEQEIDNMASAETAAEDRIAYGDVDGTVHNINALIHRDATPTRGQAVYPVMALSEAALSAHDATSASHATGTTIEVWASEQSTLLSSGHHIPPQSPQQSLERRSHEEYLERPTHYCHPDKLPFILAGQTADSTVEVTLPSITPLLYEADTRAQHRVLPPGHLRETPNNWVAERDLLYGHRMARLEALRLEIALHELDYTLFCLHHDLQRRL